MFSAHVTKLNAPIRSGTMPVSASLDRKKKIAHDLKSTACKPSEHTTDFSSIPVSTSNRSQNNGATFGSFLGSRLHFIQAKLQIGSIDDPLEHEANQTSERVLRMPNPASETPRAPLTITRRSAASRRTLEPRSETARSTGFEDSVPDIVHDVLRSSGEPLARETLEFMEPRFGRDFGEVKIHADAQGVQSAKALRARAYTSGSHIVFGEGSQDRRLLAHELTHVVQQSGGATAVQRAPSADEERAAAVREFEAYNAKQAAEEATDDLAEQKKEADAARKLQPHIDSPLDTGISCGSSKCYDPSDKELYGSRDSDDKEAATKREKESSEDATRHDRFLVLREAFAHFDYNREDVAEYLSRHYSPRDISILRHFGYKWQGWTTRNHAGQSVIEAVNRYDDDWKTKQGLGGQRMSAVTEADRRAWAKQAWLESQVRVGEEIEGGIFSAIGYGIGGDEGAHFGAILDQTFQASDGLAEGGGGGAHESSGAEIDPAVHEPFVPDAPAPTPDPVPVRADTPTGDAPSGPMRAPPGGGRRAGMTSTNETLTPHTKSDPDVTTLPAAGNAGPRGPREGAYSVDPTTPAPVSRIVRKQPTLETQRLILQRAGRIKDPATGQLVLRDANTGRAIRPGVDNFNFGHAPEYQFAPMRDWAEKQGWTQEQFDAFFEDPAKWQIEYAPYNLTKVYDKIPRQKPVH
jgi:hypothetical protein